MSFAPRLLALHSEYGYVDRLDRALPDEPEAVSEDEQRYLTKLAQHEQHERDRAIVVEVRNLIWSALALLDSPTFASYATDIRVIRRTVDRIDRRSR